MPFSFQPSEVSTYWQNRAPGIRQSGSEWRGRCPLHDGKRHSFSINSETGVWKCHSECDAGGDIIKFEQKLQGGDFKQACKTVSEIVGRPLLEDSRPKRQGKPQRRIVAEYSYVDEQGQELFQVVRYEPKDFRQRRHQPQTGLWVHSLKAKDGLPAVRKVPYHLDELKRADEAVLVEGEKDADRLRSLGFVATTTRGGAKGWRPTYAPHFRNKHVAVAPDIDDAKRNGSRLRYPGQEYAIAACRDLLKVARSVKLLELDAHDVSDWLDADGTADNLRSRISSTELLTEAALDQWEQKWFKTLGAGDAKDADSGLRFIEAGDRPIAEVSDDCLEALTKANDPPKLFVRAGGLACLKTDEKGAPIIETVDKAKLTAKINRQARFRRPTQKGDRLVPTVPDKAVEDILARTGWPFPVLSGVVESPVLRPDCSVLTKPGYDSQSGLIYCPPPGSSLPSISDNPTREELDKALRLIDETLCDFPFAEDSSRVNMIALLLTPIVRPCYQGPTPLALIEAPTPGSGKGLLALLVALIASGREAQVMTVPSERDELRKRITSLLREGANLILLDNLAETLESEVLAAVLTSDTWKDRLLGRSEMLTLPQRATWLATGNNIRLGGDLPRRCYRIRLDAHMEKPWEGRTFRHPDLRQWVLENRGGLLWALLTLGRSWFAKGRPKGENERLGSFEHWCDVVGGVLANAGVQGFLQNQPSLYEDMDDEGPEFGAFFSAWYEFKDDRPVTVAELTAQMERDPEFREVLPDLLATDFDRDKPKFKRQFGGELKKRRDVQYGPYRLESAGRDQHSKVNQWKVVFVGHAA